MPKPFQVILDIFLGCGILYWVSPIIRGILTHIMSIDGIKNIEAVIAIISVSIFAEFFEFSKKS